MKKEMKLIKIKDIFIDEELYPRTNYFWKTAYTYSNAMRVGDKFPLVVVASLNKKHYLVDGRHRIEASKILKEEFIQCEVLKGLTEKEVFVESVKRNAIHGQRFSAYDTNKIIEKLKEFKLDMGEISKIVRIPTDKIKPFQAKRMANSITGEKIPLKSAVRHLHGQTIQDNPEEFEYLQDDFAGYSQFRILKDCIDLFEKQLLNIDDLRIRKEVEKLKDIIESYDVPIVKKGRKKKAK